jgi:hypothetical protein
MRCSESSRRASARPRRTPRRPAGNGDDGCVDKIKTIPALPPNMNVASAIQKRVQHSFESTVGKGINCHRVTAGNGRCGLNQRRDVKALAD